MNAGENLPQPGTAVQTLSLEEEGPAATPAPTPAPTPGPTEAPTPTPMPTPFTVLWLSDTQDMAYARPECLEEMGVWIGENAERLNIVYVVQTGDTVESGFSPRQWEAFDACRSHFSDLPYFAIAGNHEIGVRRHDYTAYLQRDTVTSLPEKQKFQEGKAAYAAFQAGGTDFLLLGAGWEAELDAADWMEEVLFAHPDHCAILLFHGFLDDGEHETVVGKQLYPRVIQGHSNVRMVLCGHIPGSSARIDLLDDDGDGIGERSTAIMMYNFQTWGASCGQLRTLVFDPVTRSVTVTTYSPVTEREYRDHSMQATTFVLENAF